jgi:hypothetical protein
VDCSGGGVAIGGFGKVGRVTDPNKASGVDEAQISITMDAMSGLALA